MIGDQLVYFWFQLKELQDELKHKEQRWAASTSRLRDRLEYVERENAELKEEIKLLEKKRLEAWQQKEAGLPAKTDKVRYTYMHEIFSHCLSHTHTYTHTNTITQTQKCNHTYTHCHSSTHIHRDKLDYILPVH